MLGKNKDGDVKLFLVILNLPWLVYTWSVFRIQILLSKEDFANQVDGTSIWISRRPMPGDDIGIFELVIDLTAEFTKDKTDRNYICIPNLDGHWLRNCSPIDVGYAEKPILVHCANGHGRSSAYVARLLIEWGYCSNAESALNMIQASRPLAVPNHSQRARIEKG